MKRSHLSNIRMRRALLSIFVVVYLVLILIAPNKQSYLGSALAPVLEPIFNSTELGPDWRFFAPDPGSPPSRLEWEILDGQGNVVRTGEFPSPGFPYWFKDRQTRRFTASRFFFYSDERHLNVWSDWLCRSNPDAAAVRLWKAMGRIPSRLSVLSGEASISDGVVFDERSAVGNVSCSLGNESLQETLEQT